MKKLLSIIVSIVTLLSSVNVVFADNIVKSIEVDDVISGAAVTEVHDKIDITNDNEIHSTPYKLVETSDSYLLQGKV